MLLKQHVYVKNIKRNRELYKDAEYKDIGYSLIINSDNLSPHSNVKVMVRCDHCGEIYYVKMNDFTKTTNKNDGLNFCKNCRGFAQKRSVQKKYHVDNISQLQSVKDKKVETCNNNFGVDYPMQNQNVIMKAKASMQNIYGVEHNLQRPEILERVKIANAECKYHNQSAPSSKAQRYLCNLLHGELNYPCGFYNLDILLNDMVYVEYNGSGHNLNVQLGQVSQEEFNKKELIRYNYLKSLGYKCIVLDNTSDKLPHDDIITQIIEHCLILLNQNNNWVRCNLDTLSITTKYNNK